MLWVKFHLVNNPVVKCKVEPILLDDVTVFPWTSAKYNGLGVVSLKMALLS